MKQFEELKDILESIDDCPIAIPDFTSITAEQTEQKNSFIDLVLKLQKLAKELRNISLTDDLKSKIDLKAMPIDEKLLDELKQLRSSMESIQKLDANKNPFKVVSKKEKSSTNNSIIFDLCHN